jgi:hypothetical protein
MFQQELLLFLNIYMEIGITVVEVVESDSVKVLGGLCQLHVHSRLVGHGMDI